MGYFIKIYINGNTMECSDIFFLNITKWYISDTPGVARTVLQTVLEFTISTIPDLPKMYLKH